MSGCGTYCQRPQTCRSSVRALPALPAELLQQGFVGGACCTHASVAFLLPQDNICRTCGKIFSNIGRLRRHLIAAPGCLVGWGSFVPQAGVNKVKPHVLAFPEQVAGHSSAPPMLAQEDDVDMDLYVALTVPLRPRCGTLLSPT